MQEFGKFVVRIQTGVLKKYVIVKGDGRFGLVEDRRYARRFRDRDAAEVARDHYTGGLGFAGIGVIEGDE